MKGSYFKNIIFLLVFSIFTTITVTSQTMGKEPAKFRLGVIGLRHSHAWHILEDISKLSDVEIIGIAEPAEMLQNEAKKYIPDVKFFNNYNRMLSETKPDAVWSFSENNRHLEIVEACAPKGIHIVFEKPLASTFADAKTMVKLAKKYNVFLMTNYQMAWWPSNYAAYNTVSSGKIGNVWRVHAIIGHGGPGVANEPKKRPGDYFLEWLNDEEKNGGGAIVDFGCYGAVWALGYLGKPQSVQAVVNYRRPDKYNVDDNAVILCKYPKGVAILEGSWSLPRSFQDLEVFGDKGSLYVTRDKVELKLRKTVSEIELPALPENLKAPISYLIDHIRRGVPMGQIVAPEINLNVVEIIEAAKISVKTGKAVSLPLE